MAIFPALVHPVAHRGLHNLELGVAENSATAFERAIEIGYGIECDLQLSSDGEAMVIHDEAVDRVTDKTGVVAKMTAAQVSRLKLKGSKADDHILHFAEFLAQVDGRVPVAVELKLQHDGRNRELAQFAARVCEGYKGLLSFISFDPTLLHLVRQAGFRGPVGVIVSRFDGANAIKHLSAWRRFSLRNMLHVFSWRFSFIACDQHAVTMPSVRLFRALGFPVLSWTVTSQEEANSALAHCDQIAFEGFEPEQ